METRIRKVQNRSKLEDVVDNYLANGFEIKSEKGKSVILKEETGVGSVMKHLIVFLFLGWWTFAIPNFILAIGTKLSGKEVEIIIDKNPQDQRPSKFDL